MNVLIVLDGADPTGIALGDAAARLGHETIVADLRRSRFELRTGFDGHVVLDGEPLAVDVVINRTSVNGLGLASSVALDRQTGRTWYELHSAAREEQGLLLAVLDGLALRGIRVVNPPVAAELELMRNLVIERLARRGVDTRVSSSPDVSYLIVGGRIALQPGQSRPSREVLKTCNLVAEVAEFDLGEIELETAVDPPRVVRWRAALDLSHLAVPTADAMAETLVRELIGDGGTSARTPSRPFVPDMIERFETN